MNNSNNKNLEDNKVDDLIDINVGDITIDLGQSVDTITLGDFDSYSLSPSTTISTSYTYTTGPSYINTSSYTISNSSAVFINSWSAEKPFEDGFPCWDDFQKMRMEYPGLEKTFEHLKSFYNMCKDDWEAKKRGEE